MQRGASPGHSSSKERRSGISGHSHSDQEGSSEAAPRFEPRDVPPLLPLWLGGLLAASVVGVLAAVAIGYPLADHQQYRGPLKDLPPAPRLQTAPARDLAAYQSAKERELKGSNASASIAAAMQQTAKQGWGPPK